MILAGEMGARLNTPIPGHDVDLFDNYCEHLLVRDSASQEVVGTYRVLTPVAAKRAGGSPLPAAVLMAAQDALSAPSPLPGLVIG